MAFARFRHHHSIYILSGKQEVRIILTPAGLASCYQANVRYQLPCSDFFFFFFYFYNLLEPFMKLALSRNWPRGDFSHSSSRANPDSFSLRFCMVPLCCPQHMQPLLRTSSCDRYLRWNGQQSPPRRNLYGEDSFRSVHICVALSPVLGIGDKKRFILLFPHSFNIHSTYILWTYILCAHLC